MPKFCVSGAVIGTQLNQMWFRLNRVNRISFGFSQHVEEEVGVSLSLSLFFSPLVPADPGAIN